MRIKIIGANCSNGMKIMKNLNKVERELDIPLNIEKISSDEKKKYSIKVTPALMIEDTIVSEGKVLSEREIKNYIKEHCLSEI